MQKAPNATAGSGIKTTPFIGTQVDSFIGSMRERRTGRIFVVRTCKIVLDEWQHSSVGVSDELLDYLQLGMLVRCML